MSLYKRRYSLAPATNNISEKSVLSGYLKYTEQQKPCKDSCFYLFQKEFGTNEYILSPDGNYVLFNYESQKVGR